MNKRHLFYVHNLIFYIIFFTLLSNRYHQQKVVFFKVSILVVFSQVTAMKGGLKQMKKEMKKININEVEDLQDDMEDMLEDADEIQVS